MPTHIFRVAWHLAQTKCGVILLACLNNGDRHLWTLKGDRHVFACLCNWQVSDIIRKNEPVPFCCQSPFWDRLLKCHVNERLNGQRHAVEGKMEQYADQAAQQKREDPTR